MLSTGALIWVSVRPLLRLVICTGAGFFLTKQDLFPPIAARGAGQAIVNITIPSLLLSKMIPAFSSDNISALGPLILVAILYELIGVVMAWIIKQFFWVPHRFRNGILVAGGWGNWGDIPTAIVMSICASAPFSPGDSDLSVAYISAFILIFSVTLFPMGGHKLIARDFVGPDIENEEVQEAVRKQRRAMFVGWSHPVTKIRHINIRRRKAPVSAAHEDDLEDQSSNEKDVGDRSPVSPTPRPTVVGRHVSFYHDDHDATTVVPTEGIRSPAPTEGLPSRAPSPVKEERTSPIPILSHRKRYLATLREFVISLLSPPSLSIFVAFPIALIPPLKALFVPGVPGTNIPNAPDGHPPLAFLLDTWSFIGAASVPLGLICLGSALARLNIPRNQLGKLPLGAIFSLAAGKTLIMPVIGVVICQGLVNVGIIDEADKVLRFVCMFFSCLPTATTQVFITQVASSTGSAEHLSAFLIPQYFLMCFSMVGLIVYSLQLLF